MGRGYTPVGRGSQLTAVRGGSSPDGRSPRLGAVVNSFRSFEDSLSPHTPPYFRSGPTPAPGSDSDRVRTTKSRRKPPGAVSRARSFPPDVTPSTDLRHTLGGEEKDPEQFDTGWTDRRGSGDNKSVCFLLIPFCRTEVVRPRCLVV